MSKNTSSEVRVAPLVGKLPPHCQKDVSELRRFIHSLVSQGDLAAPVSPKDLRNVFLTGATGFVGRFMLRELLEQNKSLVVHCLVRATDAERGMERLQNGMKQAEIWDDAFASRIRAVVGDLGQKQFGLGEETFELLTQQIDAAYHLAADLALVSSYVAIRDVNTLSLRSLLELCLRHRRKHLFYASTLAIFPQYFCAFSKEFEDCPIEHQMQPDLGSMKKVFPLGLSGYSWSKLTAEQILLYAQQAGLPVGIFRLPQTGASSAGFVQENDFTVRMLAAMAEVDATPKGCVFDWNNETVDTLSRICTAISLNPERRYTLYNCCNPLRMSHELEPVDFGIYWREVPYESFKQLCQSQGEKSPLHRHWSLLDYFGPYWFDRSKPGFTRPISDRALHEDCPFPIKWPGLLTILKNNLRWIEERGEQWPYHEPECQMEYDRLMTQAEGYAQDLDLSPEEVFPDWIKEGLQQLVTALKAPESRLIPSRIRYIVMDLNRVLRNNVLHAQQRQKHPEIYEEGIHRPVFIVGINRTGTTFLHRLLYRDQRFWALRGYELIKPVVPPDVNPDLAGTTADPRRVYLEDMLEASGVTEVFAGLHPIDIDEPEEEFGLLRQSFSSWVGTVRHHVPAYEKWLESTGSEKAYGHHRLALQFFNYQNRQQKGQQGQWLLKMPFHLMELEALVKAYPDALFIQTHREPVQFMGSWNSLVERIRSRSMEPHPPEVQGAEQLAFMSQMMNRAMDFRLAHPEVEHRWIDINYLDLIEDPLAIVRIIYEHFGWSLKQVAVDRMDQWLFNQAQKRKQAKRHHYDLADYGLTPEVVNEAFARYRTFMTDRGIRESRL